MTSRSREDATKLVTKAVSNFNTDKYALISTKDPPAAGIDYPKNPRKRSPKTNAFSYFMSERSHLAYRSAGLCQGIKDVYKPS
eukprot:784862-Amphidinium_carterae.1